MLRCAVLRWLVSKWPCHGGQQGGALLLRPQAVPRWCPPSPPSRSAGAVRARFQPAPSPLPLAYHPLAQVDTSQNNVFLDTMEAYFSQPTEALMADVRPQLAYQVRGRARVMVAGAWWESAPARAAVFAPVG